MNAIEKIGLLWFIFGVGMLNSTVGTNEPGLPFMILFGSGLLFLLGGSELKQ